MAGIRMGALQTRPNRLIGFLGSWGVVGVILFLLWLMANIR